MVDKDRILSGCEQLFLESGIKSITMDDIARHLGISKKTIYQHFRDKNELVTTLVKQRLADDEAMLCAIISDTGNVMDEMVELTRCTGEIFSRVNPAVLFDLQKYHHEGWGLYLQFKTGFLVNIIEKLLRKGIEQGYIRPEIDARIIAIMRVNQIELGFNASIYPHAEFNLWDVQLQLLNHFNYGVCSIKGITVLNNAD
ncbi:DNA-binding transcriptional regulator, AcrR family [Mucilaginibacter gossypiicola]|uniref:DNA-binding transcriptional regulator, AcrR family n=1 Tax=Mucilaginibacter gossypiicola TaxID=551995 RepID=A0A1H8KK05_9SPHI|nr:TetR/AcrR family transcriptional regulator [Mucilaginibacter gossypiicola]SEN93205.1 DNA-binding transcriptional regulator, AcrR family [Mucilaginibacter gossypiicola]